MGDAKNITVAIIQLHPEPLKVEENFQKAQAFIKQAASSGASLAVLPEYCLTGWYPEHPLFGEAVSDKSYLGRFQELAKSLDINIVPGTLVEQHEGEGGIDVLYNVAYFISRTGEVVGQYTKRNLWGPERKHLTSSGDIPHEVFQTEYGPCGLLVCWDLASQDAGDYGYKLNPQSEELFINSTIIARAFENAAAIVYVNVGGPAKELFTGCSQVAVPFLGAISKTDSCEEQMKIVTIDMEIVHRAEEHYQVRSDMLSNEWGYPSGYVATK